MADCENEKFRARRTLPLNSPPSHRVDIANPSRMDAIVAIPTNGQAGERALYDLRSVDGGYIIAMMVYLYHWTGRIIAETPEGARGEYKFFR